MLQMHHNSRNPNIYTIVFTEFKAFDHFNHCQELTKPNILFICISESSLSKKLHILDIVMEHFSRNNNNNDISEDVHSHKSHQSFQSIPYVVLIRKFLLCSDLKYIYIIVK